MAAVLTGTPVEVTWAAGSNPAAQNISIPSDATAVYMFWAYYSGSADGLASATLNSQAPSQTNELQNIARPGGVAVWYNPSTGTQSLDVAWDGTPSEGPSCIVVFVKDGDTSSWRDVDITSAEYATPVTVTLTTVSGDLVIKFDTHFGVTVPSLSSGWTNGQTQTNNSQGSRASYISATGSSQQCDSEDEDWSTIVAVAIGPVSGPTISVQPNNATKFTSETAGFSVTATGTGTLTYQWKVSTDGSSYSNVSSGSGGTTNSYTTATLGYSDNANYYKCTVTDDNGSTNSNSAFLTVIGAASGAWLRY